MVNLHSIEPTDPILEQAMTYCIGHYGSGRWEWKIENSTLWFKTSIFAAWAEAGSREDIEDWARQERERHE